MLGVVACLQIVAADPEVRGFTISETDAVRVRRPRTAYVFLPSPPGDAWVIPAGCVMRGWHPGLVLAVHGCG